MSKFRRKNRIFSNCRFANSRKFFEKQKTARSTNQRSIWFIFFANWIFLSLFLLFWLFGHSRPSEAPEIHEVLVEEMFSFKQKGLYIRRHWTWAWTLCEMLRKNMTFSWRLDRTLRFWGDIGPGHYGRCCTHLPWPPPPSGQSLLVEPATENVIH